MLNCCWGGGALVWYPLKLALNIEFSPGLIFTTVKELGLPLHNHLKGPLKEGSIFSGISIIFLN